MRKKQIIVLGIVMGAALLGLIFTQAKYFQTAFNQRKAEFDYLVHKSLDQVIAYIDEREKEYSRARENEMLAGAGERFVHEMPIGLGVKPEVSMKDMNIVIDYSRSPLG